MTIEEINTYSDELDEPLLFADGFDECIIGLAEGFGGHMAIAYDKSKMLAKLVSDGMSYEEAVEYFDFNIAGAYVGIHTPIYIETLTNES
jgi:hypothetical protein